MSLLFSRGEPLARRSSTSSSIGDHRDEHARVLERGEGLEVRGRLVGSPAPVVRRQRCRHRRVDGTVVVGEAGIGDGSHPEDPRRPGLGAHP